MCLPVPAYVCATSVRVGFHLGHNDVTTAKYIMRVSSVVGSALAVIVGVAMILCRDVMGRVFSHDPAVWDLTSKICVLVGRRACASMSCTCRGAVSCLLAPRDCLDFGTDGRCVHVRVGVLRRHGSAARAVA